MRVRLALDRGEGDVLYAANPNPNPNPIPNPNPNPGPNPDPYPSPNPEANVLDRGEGDALHAPHWGGLPQGDLLHLGRGRGYGLGVRG